MATDNTNILKGVTLQEQSDKSKSLILLPGSGATTNTSMTVTANQTANRVITLPDASGNLVLTDSTDTGAQRLQNKELDDATVFFVDNLDTTKKLAFQLSGLTTATTRTLTIPDVSTTILGTDNIATVTNKIIVVANNTITTAASGNLTAIELNAALAELQADIDTRGTSADLTAHTSATSGVHGVTGDVVGTTDAQAISGKTSIAVDNLLLDGNTISSTNTNGDIILDPNGTGAIQIAAQTSGSISLKAALTTTPHTLIFPSAQAVGTQFLQNDGAGNLSWVSGGVTGASTALDNLTATSINQSLIPNTDGTLDLGSSSLAWSSLYTRTVRVDTTAGTEVITIAGTVAGAITPTSVPQIIGSSLTGNEVLALTSLNSAVNDSNTTGGISIYTGNKTAGTGNSGNITFQTGTSAGGLRGQITIDARRLQMSGAAIVGMADPTDPQDAATKNYVDVADTATINYIDTFNPSVRLADSTGQTIANNTLTVWTPDTEVFDANNLWNTGTSTFTAPSAGKYMIFGSAFWGIPADPYAIGNLVQMLYRINGAGTFWVMASFTQNVANSAAVSIMGTGPLANLAANDTVQIYVFQNSGGNVALVAGVDQCSVSIIRVGN